MKIKYKQTDNLKLFRNNTNYMSEDKFNELKHSIKLEGIFEPLIVSEDNVVIDGNHRLIVARELKMEEVPCIIKSKLAMEDCAKWNLQCNLYKGLINFDEAKNIIQRFDVQHKSITEISKILGISEISVLQIHELNGGFENEKDIMFSFSFSKKNIDYLFTHIEQIQKELGLRPVVHFDKVTFYYLRKVLEQFFWLLLEKKLGNGYDEVLNDLHPEDNLDLESSFESG